MRVVKIIRKKYKNNTETIKKQNIKINNNEIKYQY